MDIVIRIGIALTVALVIAWIIGRRSSKKRAASNPLVMGGVGTYQAAKLRELRERFRGAIFTGTRTRFGCGHIQGTAAMKDGWHLRTVAVFDARRYNCHTCLLKDGIEVVVFTDTVNSAEQSPEHTTRHGNVIDLDARR